MKSKRIPPAKPVAIAIASLIAAAPAAWAQQPASSDASQLSRVVVTGSNIKRISAETSQPLLVVSREEILAAGALTVGEVLGNLATNDGSAISDLGGANSWASGASGVSLRNLGTGGTLVLVNGRRIASYGFADGLQLNFTNIDAIPANIIERVEILKDGASAIYGSDAIGGVINIITRKDFTGVEVSASAMQSTRSSLLRNEKLVSVTGGFGSLDREGFNVYAHLEAFKRGNYKDRQIREHLPAWFVAQNPDRDLLSTGAFPGNYTGRYPANYPDPALAGKSINVAAPGCKPEQLVGGLCRYDYWKDSDATPGTNRITALAGARVKLGDTMTAFAEFQGADIKAKYYTAIPRSSITGVPLNWYDSIKGEMQYFTDPQLPVGHPYNPYPFPIGLNYRFIDHPDMFKNVGASTQYRLFAGVEGQLGAWDFETAVGVMRSHATQRQHLYRDRYAYYDAIVSGEYKFGQQNSRELLEKMFPEMGSSGTYQQKFIDLKGSRQVGELPGGPLMLALGSEFRREEFRHQSADNILAARIVQFSGVKIAGERSTGALFAELNAPLTKEIEATLALRGDKVFEGAGAVTPKIQLAWRPNSQVLIRGTATQGFRAPSLPETGNGGASWFNNGYLDPKRCDAATKMRDILRTGNDLDKVNAVTAYALGCTVSFPSSVTPNPNLKPEHSENFSWGIVLQPTDNITLSLDYYNIRRRDEIGTRDIDNTLANEDRIPGLVERSALTVQDIEFAQRVRELSGQNIAFAVGPVKTIAMQYQNQTRTRVSGIDVEVRGRWSLGDWGRFDAGVEANYQLDFRGWDTFTNGYTENYVGYRDKPKIKAVFKFGWKYGNWSTGLRLNYRDAQQLAWNSFDSANTIEGCADRGVAADDCRIRARLTSDLSVRYSGFKGLTLGMNVFNLGNDPDPVLMRPGTGLPLDGRSIKLSADYRF